MAGEAIRQAMQDIADDRAGRRCDDADDARQIGDELLARRIEQESDGALRFTLASLYPLLYRMEKRGWTKATWETTPAGVRRRCYGLTAKGVKQLGATRREWDAFFLALSRIGGLRRA